ncbi:DNA endonuclease [Pseudomonas phage 201phi2-1]|uniref:Uncharacterized protein n=1 Tax=Pseudomonas phage 201phi2-1 TaxID=198110 RepID=B3FJ84_BP201|nr:DNA endonuclease [Pseudomonas phage 201phi2-1]ABY63051.1 hypothetical protein 201phi2-1p222 [Pseudomonas phage 201phi2-1]
MKKLEQKLLPVVAFGPDDAKQIIEYVETLDPSYWFHRLKINSIPTKGTNKANYWFMGDGQMPKALKEYLNELAPTIDGFKPAEICLNRYEVGNGMPEHIDQAFYRYNMVIPLSNHGDGLFVEDEWYVDRPGSGLIMPIKSPPHHVPDVKHRRYTLIYLYD